MRGALTAVLVALALIGGPAAAKEKKPKPKKPNSEKR